MLRKVLRGLAGIVVVRRAMLIVMMALATDMGEFMGDVKHFYERKRTALHGKALQGQHQHQKNAKETTHRNFVDRSDRGLYRCCRIDEVSKEQ